MRQPSPHSLNSVERMLSHPSTPYEDALKELATLRKEILELKKINAQLEFQLREKNNS